MHCKTNKALLKLFDVLRIQPHVEQDHD